MDNFQHWQVGKAKITVITEIDDAAEVIKATVPALKTTNISKIPWLVPYFVDDTGNIKASVNVFIIEINGKQIVVDTGVGNFKQRPELIEWNNLNTNFLKRFKLAGFDTNKIDFVLNSHFHFDHIGWNTMLENDRWIPTFSNATYVLVKEEFEYWESNPKTELEDDRLAFTDSILPIHQAGLTKLVSPNYQLLPQVSLLSMPGHTPFHSGILIESEGSKALIIGDTLHHPAQIAKPEWPCAFDTYPQKAAESRRSLLEKFANTGTLIIGTHFSTPSAGLILKNNDSFKFVIE